MNLWLASTIKSVLCRKTSAQSQIKFLMLKTPEFNLFQTIQFLFSSYYNVWNFQLFFSIVAFSILNGFYPNIYSYLFNTKFRRLANQMFLIKSASLTKGIYFSNILLQLLLSFYFSPSMWFPLLVWISLTPLLILVNLVLFEGSEEYSFENTSINKNPWYLDMSVWTPIWTNHDSRSIFGFLILNGSYMLIQLVYGFWSNSLGLISDAIHMFFDCAALAIGLIASVMATWPTNRKFTYG